VIIMSGTVAFSAVRYVEQARRASTEAQLASLQLALHAYYLDTGTYPTTGQGLQALWEPPLLTPVPVGWRGPYVERPVTVDGWGRPFDYQRRNDGGVPFVITSFGADGLPGGSGGGDDVTSTG